MKNFVGHNIIIIEPNIQVAGELSLAMKKGGAETTIMISALEALLHLKDVGADVVICGSLSFRDTQLLHEWHAQNRNHAPKFIQLITEASEKSPFPCIHFKNVTEVIEQLPQFIFGINDFFKTLLTVNEPKVITYQLKVHNSTIDLEPLEVTSEGLYLSTEANFAFDSVKSLQVSFRDSQHNRTFQLPGVLEYHDKGGPFFRVHSDYQFQWEIVLNNFRSKQADISGFLKKVAGF